MSKLGPITGILLGVAALLAALNGEYVLSLVLSAASISIAWSNNP